MVFDRSVTVRVELNQQRNTLGRFGELVSSLLGGCILEICSIVLQNLIGASQANNEGRRVNINRVDEDANCIAANKSNTKIT